MTPFARAVRAEVMRAFAAGANTPTTASIGRALQCDPGEVALAFEELAHAHALVLQPGSHRIWMAHPFSGVSTPHCVRIGQRSWYANCVWDGLAILALMGDGTLETHYGGEGEPVQFTVRGGKRDGGW
jgi:hypothetical protein